MKQKRKREPNTWTPNWSGRGIAMLNRMEQFDNYQDHRAFRSTKILSYKAKLTILLKCEPNNQFYKSLHQQVQRYLPSPKQINAVEKCFDYLRKQHSPALS